MATLHSKRVTIMPQDFKCVHDILNELASEAAGEGIESGAELAPEL